MMKHACLLPCPACGAPAGARCDISKLRCGQFSCIARQFITTPGRITRIPEFEIVHPFRGVVSQTCKSGSHNRCSGYLKGTHGLLPETCHCWCHENKLERKNG